MATMKKATKGKAAVKRASKQWSAVGLQSDQHAVMMAARERLIEELGYEIPRAHAVAILCARYLETCYRRK